MRHRLVLFSLLITWVSFNALAQLNPLSENTHARMVFQRALTAENRKTGKSSSAWASKPEITAHPMPGR